MGEAESDTRTIAELLRYLRSPAKKNPSGLLITGVFRGREIGRLRRVLAWMF